MWVYDDLHKEINDDEMVYYYAQVKDSKIGGDIVYSFHSDQTTEEQTFWIKDPSLGTYTANYTEEEINYWFELTYNTIKEYHGM